MRMKLIKKSTILSISIPGLLDSHQYFQPKKFVFIIIASNSNIMIVGILKSSNSPISPLVPEIGKKYVKHEMTKIEINNRLELRKDLSDTISFKNILKALLFSHRNKDIDCFDSQ